MEENKDIRTQRLEKLEEYRKAGIETYPTSYEVALSASEALAMEEEKELRVVGRLVSKRLMGKASFAHIKDSSGQIQIYVRKDIIGEDAFSIYKTLDIGDFVGVHGKVFVTRTGEKSVLVDSYKFLAKSLRPLPEKFHGLKDVETRYRKRYLDILVNENTSSVLKARARILTVIRDILYKKGYIEVETPILQPLAGGAAARPFMTHHNVYDSELSLRIAPELYLKRLLVGGWDRVFEIGRNFRNEGVSNRHNPEFTMMEVYCAYKDFTYMMELAKEIIVSLWDELKGEFEPAVDLSLGWERDDLWDLLKKHTGYVFSPEDTLETLREKAEKLDIPPGKDSEEKIVDRIFSKYVEPKLISPVFVTGYPAKHSPLAKRSPENEKVAERFEIFINGQEIGNAYSEQNDPQIQEKMFIDQLKDSEVGNKRIDDDYIEALEYGMPPAAGLGIGIDRLIMLLTGAENIREVILFPMLKPVIEQQ